MRAGPDTVKATVAPQRSDLAGGRRLAAHLGLLAATEAVTLRSWGHWWLAPALIANGVVLCALFCAAHESVHRTAFRTRWANDAVSATCGLALLLPSRWFRLFHAAHHRHTQDPERDPELAGWKPDTRVGIVLHGAGLLYWWAMARTIVALAMGRADASFLPPGHRRRVVAQAHVYLGVYVAIAAVSLVGRSTLALQMWVLPVIVGQPFLRAFLLAEHSGRPHVADVMVSTRTTLTNRGVRLLSWNMAFHAEHHAHPQVPFHQLQALHRTMAAELRSVGRGYARTVLGLQRDRWRAAGRADEAGRGGAR